MGGRLRAIDGLRGIAILMVTLFHLWRLAGQPQIEFGRLDLTPLFPYGASGVAIFYCLSGFGLYLPLAQRAGQGQRWPGWGGFYLRRIGRIYPPYLVAVLVFSPLWASWKGWANWPRDLVTHLTFTHTLFPETIYSINGVLWFMGPLVHFLVIYPVLAWLMRRAMPLAVAGAFGVSAWIEQHPEMVGLTRELYVVSMFNFLPNFVVGMLVGGLVVRWPQPARWLVNLAWLIGLARLCLWPYISTAPVIGVLSTWKLLPALSWGALVWALAVPARPDPQRGCYLAAGLGRVFASRPLLWIAAISYSLYLYNYSMNYMTQLYPGLEKGSLVWWGVTIGLTLSVAALAHYMIEKPLGRIWPRSNAEDRI